LQSVVSNYENQKEDIIHAVKSQLTLLQTVDKETKQNTVDLLNVARTLRQVVFDVVYLNRTISSVTDKTRIAFEVQKNISRTMRELEFTVLRLQQELMQLHEGIDISSSGRLSSVLVPPNNISSLLQQTALKLPRDYLY
jgi:transcription initiation factor TFIID subunit TAF12